ncbi:MAG: hypothetical protein AAGB11_02475 [Pseudomonadota bacterium]
MEQDPPASADDSLGARLKQRRAADKAGADPLEPVQSYGMLGSGIDEDWNVSVAYADGGDGAEAAPGAAKRLRDRIKKKAKPAELAAVANVVPDLPSPPAEGVEDPPMEGAPPEDAPMEEAPKDEAPAEGAPTMDAPTEDVAEPELTIAPDGPPPAPPTAFADAQTTEEPEPQNLESGETSNQPVDLEPRETEAVPLQPEPRPSPPPRGGGDRPIIAIPDAKPTNTPREGAPARPARVSGRSKRTASETAGRVREFLNRDLGIRNRRAPRIEGGGSVLIGDDIVPLVDWSTGGIAIAGGGQTFRLGDVWPLELDLDMGDYAVNLDLDGEVVNRWGDKVGWRFVEPTRTQKRVLVSLSAAAEGGEGQNRAFDAVERRPQRERPQPSDSVVPRRRKLLDPSAVLLAVVFNAAIIALVATVIIFRHDGDRIAQALGPKPTPVVAEVEPAPVLRARSAAVAVERRALVSNAAGTVLEWNVAPGEAVATGAALVSLEPEEAPGTSEVIASPCDCTFAQVLAPTGVSVGDGENIGLLYARDSEGHVQAIFPFGEEPRLGEKVVVNLPSTGERYAGVVERVGLVEDSKAYIGLPSYALGAMPATVVAHIRTTPSVPAALAGDPAIVTFERATPTTNVQNRS